jgi:hypothetical protein
MSSTEKAAQLRALAEQFEGLGALEDDLSAAVEAYRADPSQDNKVVYEDAKLAIRTGRKEIRESDLMAVANEPGSSTVGVAPVQVGRSSAPAPSVKGS